jgi:4'-phosphopantetheinyl transferase EntD
LQTRIDELELGRLAVVAFDAAELAQHAAGRVAMRLLLPELAAIGTTDRGAPELPPAWSGSITHKPNLAAALVAPAEHGHVGVDLEVASARKIDISRRILTPREQAALPAILSEDRGAAVTLRFAIKEAIYKAVDPIVRRYVGFTEVELDVGDDGSCAVSIVDPARLPVIVEARWQMLDGLWLATARALRTSP